MVSQSGSVGCTLMGKTADFTLIKMRIIVALYKETLKVIVKAAVCSRRAVSMHINGKMEVEKKGNVVGKRCTRNSYNRNLEKIAKRRCEAKPIQEYREIKEWTPAGVRMWAAAVTFLLSNQRRRWRLTWAKDRTALLLLRGPTSASHVKDDFTFMVDIMVPEPGGRVEMHRSLSSSSRSSAKWWLVSWNSWFHFPAGLGNCPHCSKHRYLM